jgi:septum site-determining protein MinC
LVVGGAAVRLSPATWGDKGVAVSRSMGTSSLHLGSSPGGGEQPAIVVRGASVVLPVAHLASVDVAVIERELSAKVAQAAQLLRDAPLVIDLHEVEQESLDLVSLLNLLRGHGLVPIAVRGGSGGQQAAARQQGLGIVQGRKTPARVTSQSVAQPAAEERLITQPVRSGQRVFVPNGDLVILGQVNTGAEVIASGNIHVYGPLRGRAMAGVAGDASARILTTYLEAQLVAVAGVYRALEDDLPPELRAKPAQVFLDGERLAIEPLSFAGESPRKS